jgi:hypothetical protein
LSAVRRPDLLPGLAGRCAVAVAVLALAVAGAGCGGRTVSTKSSTAAAARPPRPSAQAEHALLAAIKTARTCLGHHGLHSSGGPIYPQDSPTSPDGELILGGAKAGAYITFYTSAARAKQLEPQLAENTRRAHGRLERRGAVALLFLGHPAETFRAAVSDCAFS